VVGRHVVAALAAAGYLPVPLARSTGVDLMTGHGLDAALHGVSCVIDVSNVATTRRARASAFFEAGTRHLLAAEEGAGVGHHVVLSIVGVDRVDVGYYLGKRHQEELVLTGAVPSSVLRATQFHEFAAQFLARGGPLPVVPQMLCRPVAAREVAHALVGLVASGAVGRAPDLAGPQVERMPDLVRRLLRARGSRRPVIALRVPGRAGAGMAGGGLLPTAAGPFGGQTFEQWLASPDADVAGVGARGAAGAGSGAGSTVRAGAE
jgi:hypothetical protein